MTISDVLGVPSISGNFDVERLRRSLSENNEKLRTAFVMYVLEALFFDSVLDDDLAQLRNSASILEVGAGIGLLSMLTSLRGFTVTAYEPESDGFGHMRQIRKILGDCWIGPALDVTFIDDYFTNNVADGPGFEFAYAINVIEHVPDPERLIQDVTSSLSPDGRARFICPNYDFPYEPHLGIPTLWNKSLTKRVFRRSIGNSSIDNIEAFWSDLSWPSVRTLKRGLAGCGVHLSFDRRAVRDYVSRLETDAGFVERKGRLFKFARAALTPLISFGAKIIPVRWLPIIDLTTRRASGRPSQVSTASH
ncbi:class I SAM-dependent methyltransferase [Pseudomonadota bacterium]